MKKVFILCAAAAVLSVACTAVNQEEFKLLSVKGVRAEETKTAYAGEVSFSWSAGDQISVLCNDGGQDFWQTFTVDHAPSASSTFSARVPAGVSVGALDGTRVALYPASEGHVYNSASDIRFHIPAERDFRGHPETAIPMFAWGDGDDAFSFANLTGAAKFTFSNIPAAIAAVKLVFSNGSARLNGTYPLSLNGDASQVGWSASTTGTASEHSVSLTAEVADGIASFYIPYATGTLASPNEIVLTDAAKPSEVLFGRQIGAVSVKKNQVAVLPVIDVGTGQAETRLTSAFGIDWEGIPAFRNTSAEYPALRTLKATADADFLYLYFEVDPTVLTKTHDYDHQFKLYISDPGGSQQYWGAATCQSINKDVWAVVQGNMAFKSWDPTPFEENLHGTPSTWSYEVKVSRSHEKASALLGNAGVNREVGIGLVLDDLYVTGDQWARLNQYKPYGVIPTAGSDLYPVLLPGSNGGSGGSSQDYTESDDVLANPERGLYKFVEYHYNADGSTSPAASYSLKDKYDDANTLVMALFYLHAYVDGGTLSQPCLDYIRNVLTNVRASGKKAIVRFGYSNTHVSDSSVDPRTIHQEPDKDQILAHIAQIKPILQDFEDIICVAQAGFIGTYGEWYYTTHFSTFTKEGSKWKESRDWTYHSSTDQVEGFENRHEVLEAILDAYPASRQVEVRTPAYKQYYLSPGHVSQWTELGGFGTEPVNRIAFHNDAFLYGGSDMGTFHYDYEKAQWRQQGQYLICGGEAPYSSTAVSEMEGYSYNNVLSGIYGYHYTYLHHDTGYPSGSSSGSTLFRHWYEQGWIPAIKKMLGYRLYLTHASVSGNGRSAGNTLDISLSLANSGAAPVVNARPMELVLLHEGTATVLEANVGDIRLVPPATVSGTTVKPGTKTYIVSVTLPRDIVAGDRLALWLPDADPNGQGLQTRKEYAIRLANKETTWTDTGYNVFYTF